MRVRFAAVLPVAAVLALAGCKSDCGSCSVGGGDAQAAGFVNANCPIAGNAIDVNLEAVDFDGNKIGFCCPGCKDGWNEMADADKEGFVAKALAGNG